MLLLIGCDATSCDTMKSMFSFCSCLRTVKTKQGKSVTFLHKYFVVKQVTEHDEVHVKTIH